jgi:hypothetical protein
MKSMNVMKIALDVASHRPCRHLKAGIMLAMKRGRRQR